MDLNDPVVGFKVFNNVKDPTIVFYDKPEKALIPYLCIDFENKYI